MYEIVKGVAGGVAVKLPFQEALAIGYIEQGGKIKVLRRSLGKLRYYFAVIVGLFFLSRVCIQVKVRSPFSRARGFRG
jgi:hypothetical protein